MANLLRMPASAAGAESAIVADWSVAVNEPVRQGETILVIETDKALLDITAEANGVLLRTLVEVGQPVSVGAPVAILGSRGEEVDVDALLALAADAPQPSETKPAATPRPQPNTAAARDVAATTGRVFASPLARRLAAQNGVDIATVPGTGPGGRVTRRDIERHLAAIPPPNDTARSSQECPAIQADQASESGQESPIDHRPLTAEPASSITEIIPHSRVRRTIATRLTRSKNTIPHFYLHRTCRVDNLLSFRAEINADPDTRVSINDLLVKAVGRAHYIMPAMDAIWTDDGIRRLATTDVGVAVNTERGLLTPVLRHVATRTVTDLAASSRDLISRAKSGQLNQIELEGGSITVSNLGMFGVEEFSAIINPPQSAILAVGAARQAPTVLDGKLEVATVMRVVLSIDHRVHDGAFAAQWLDLFVRLIESPLHLVL